MINPALVHIDAAQQAMLKSWFIALNWISFGLGLVTLVINMSSARKRAFPARLTTVFTASCCLFHVVLLFGYVYDFKQLTIPEEPTARWSTCSIQGGFFQLAALSVVCWWSIVCYNLWRVVAMGDTVAQARRREPYYHLIAWGLPLATCIALFVLKGYGTEVGALYCWVTTKDGSWWKVSFFYTIMTVCVMVGIGWGVSIMLTVRRFQRQYKATVARHQRLGVGLHADGGTARGRRVSGSAPRRGLRLGSGHASPRTSGLSPAAGASSPGAASTSPRVRRVSSGAGSVGAGEHFTYYLKRQVLFLLVFLVRFCVFAAWEVNYKLFQNNSAPIGFPFAFVVNYCVSTLGFDCFWLIGLARDSRIRMRAGAAALCGKRCRMWCRHGTSKGTESLLSDAASASVMPGDAQPQPRDSTGDRDTYGTSLGSAVGIGDRGDSSRLSWHPAYDSDHAHYKSASKFSLASGERVGVDVEVASSSGKSATGTVGVKPAIAEDAPAAEIP